MRESGKRATQRAYSALRPGHTTPGDSRSESARKSTPRTSSQGHRVRYSLAFTSSTTSALARFSTSMPQSSARLRVDTCGYQGLRWVGFGGCGWVGSGVGGCRVGARAGGTRRRWPRGSPLRSTPLGRRGGRSAWECGETDRERKRLKVEIISAESRARLLPLLLIENDSFHRLPAARATPMLNPRQWRGCILRKDEQSTPNHTATITYDDQNPISPVAVLRRQLRLPDAAEADELHLRHAVVRGAWMGGSGYPCGWVGGVGGSMRGLLRRARETQNKAAEGGNPTPRQHGTRFHPPKPNRATAQHAKENPHLSCLPLSRSLRAPERSFAAICSSTAPLPMKSGLRLGTPQMPRRPARKLLRVARVTEKIVM